MRIAAAKIKTSQLYFNVGDVDDFKDEVVVTAWVDSRRMLKAFGIVGTFDWFEQIADYGFCQMRMTKNGTVEFVTTIRYLKKTVEHMRAFLKAKRWAREFHAERPAFVVDMYGDLGALRKLKVNRAAERAGCVQRGDFWCI